MSLTVCGLKPPMMYCAEMKSASQKGDFKPPFKWMEVSIGLAVVIVVNLVVDILFIGLSI